jgi:protein tyrosine/serine phosphatase
MTRVMSLLRVFLANFVLWPLTTSCAGPADVLPLGLPLNFHIVDADRFYRSAQPTADSLKTVAEVYNIRTVINLRGTNEDEPWYASESRICGELGVRLIDHAMSARSLPSGELLGHIEESLRSAEYPVLLHCESGSDRSGAVSAIYRMLVLGQDRTTAARELSPEYLHFRDFRPCMDKLIEIFEPTPEWLAQYSQSLDQIECTP